MNKGIPVAIVFTTAVGVVSVTMNVSILMAVFIVVGIVAVGSAMG